MSVGRTKAEEYKKEKKREREERERGEREREKKEERERKTNLYSREKERKREKGPRHQWLIVGRQSCTSMPLILTNDDIPQRND